MKKRRVQAGSLPSLGKIRNTTELPGEDAVVRFSFRHLDLNTNPKFSLSHCQTGYLEKFLPRLRDVSSVSLKSFKTKPSDSLRNHVITWNDTTEPNGFVHLHEQLRAEQAWQFHVTSNKHGRVHGFLIDDTFFVVWIDPDHKLYL